jgi:hypothetical protein
MGLHESRIPVLNAMTRDGSVFDATVVVVLSIDDPPSFVYKLGVFSFNVLMQGLAQSFTRRSVALAPDAALRDDQEACMAEWGQSVLLRLNDFAAQYGVTINNAKVRPMSISL